MYFDMLVEGLTECKIRVPSFEGSHKGSYGTLAEIVASPSGAELESLIARGPAPNSDPERIRFTNHPSDPRESPVRALQVPRMRRRPDPLAFIQHGGPGL